ncbi:tRNA 2-thiouridine(34) synthase MnmA [Candidatus Venteria ishoeyi]|uniref:tRNA 2-thiouridine(34) synthase MnmA n=1 Tax=Candidatus Venteria ishoeyi TaxID=1899563 RepID=UPI0025A53F95|nr:tRNA 2-thiouridine(34) synthase MnmA [Candidatus Venteria ishoeyi]MDM8547844.1 tRNA 2-thiouridine(34) synthase MnmA [Candidatus Venteria ishoeyi]
MSEKIMIGMSGGVDSSVAALLLQQQGYEVHGLFMKNWEEDDNPEYCSAAEDLSDAQAVCDKLAIPLHTVNFSAEYWDNVFTHFLAEYQAGRTPNPDVLCNREIKFKVFLEHARKLGAGLIATGHYVANRQQDGKWQLLRGLDKNKDQSYFLYMLEQKQLQPSRFPIGHLEKPEVRKMAAQAGLITHRKKDSTGICFIGERRFKDFLSQYLPANPGKIVSADGQVMGRHDGLMYYTLGQRQGLNIGGVKQGSGEPWYVVAKDLDNNQLIVAQGHDHPLLFNQQLQASEVHWIAGESPSYPLQCTAKTRYRQGDQNCIVNPIDGENIQVEFEQAQRAITPGQSIVFYHNEVCLGGAIIETFC